MNRSKQDMILLDEKIARIRKQNEEIIRRKQEIDEEIAREKEVNVSLHYFENEKPKLYSDDFASRKSQSSNENAAWRAERDQIDRERILRQKSNNGWKREWDADKIISNEEKHFVPQDSFSTGISRTGNHQSSGRNDWCRKLNKNTWDRNFRTDSTPRRYEDEVNSMARRTENNRNFVSCRNDTDDDWNRNSKENSHKFYQRGSFPKPDRFSDHHDPKPCRTKNNGNSTTDWMKQQNKDFSIDRKQQSQNGFKIKNRSNLQRRVERQLSQIDEYERIDLIDNLKNITIMCNNVNRGERFAVLSEESSLLHSHSKVEPFSESIVEKIRECVTELSNCEISRMRITLSKSLNSKPAVPENTARVAQERKESADSTANKLSRILLKRGNSGFVRKPRDYDSSKMKRTIRTPKQLDQTVSTPDGSDDEWEDISGEDEDDLP